MAADSLASWRVASHLPNEATLIKSVEQPIYHSTQEGTGQPQGWIASNCSFPGMHAEKGEHARLWGLKQHDSSGQYTPQD